MSLQCVFQLKQVEEYIRYRKLPCRLKHKMYEYYYQRYHGHLFNEQAILDELSHSLKEVRQPPSSPLSPTHLLLPHSSTTL